MTAPTGRAAREVSRGKDRTATGSEPEAGGDGLAAPARERIYVNHCTVSMSLATAELDFGQVSEAGQQVLVQSRLVTSHSYFRQLGDLIRAECRRHDEAFNVRPGSEGS